MQVGAGYENKVRSRHMGKPRELDVEEVEGASRSQKASNATLTIPPVTFLSYPGVKF